MRQVRNRSFHAFPDHQCVRLIVSVSSWAHTMLHHLRVVVPAAAAALWALQRLIHSKGGEPPGSEALAADQASVTAPWPAWGAALAATLHFSPRSRVARRRTAVGGDHRPPAASAARPLPPTHSCPSHHVPTMRPMCRPPAG